MTVSTPSARRTPLFELHRSLGARMTVFHGWEMPLEFSGILNEHRAVRQSAGLFDISHMGLVWVEGAQSRLFLDRLLPAPVRRLAPGKALYSPLLNTDGKILDDLIVYQTSSEAYWVVVNASNAESDLAWFRQHAPGDLSIELKNSDWALIALQGPLAMTVLAETTGQDFSALTGFSIVRAQGLICGLTGWVARTGYTGEDGVEMVVSAEHATPLCQKLLQWRGGPQAVQPIGLGARDTLRLEARLLLYGQDMDLTVTPLEVGLGWTVDGSKSDFLGRQALEDQRRRGPATQLIGLELCEPGIARHAAGVRDASGTRVGVVTSGSYGPTVAKSIALARVSAPAAELGTEYSIEVRDRCLRARSVATPFYRRKK